MNELLCREHNALRESIALLRTLKTDPRQSPEAIVTKLKVSLAEHFKKEETFYRVMDQDKTHTEKGLVHQLRNDHAAMTFGMESLLIRLRKNGANTDWWAHFEKLMAIFEPHLELEEKQVFPHLENNA